jgi:hypothetical protein
MKMVVMRKGKEKKKCHIKKYITRIITRRKHFNYSFPPNLRTTQRLMPEQSIPELNIETTYFIFEPYHL